MTVNKVELCGVNTAKLPLLKEEEKEELFERIKAGDEEAREKYIKGNLRLVLSVIKRFENSSDNADDLFQIGCVGLMKAVDHFDPGRMVKFSTYAVPMIIGEIRRYLRDNSPIRVHRLMQTHRHLNRIKRIDDLFLGNPNLFCDFLNGRLFHMPLYITFFCINCLISCIAQ